MPAENAEALADALTTPFTEIAEAAVPEPEPEPAPAVRPDASLAAPDSIEIGLTFNVPWERPGEDRDSVQVFDAQAKGGRGQVLASKRLINDAYDDKKISMKVPDKPGNYMLRYHNGDSDIVLYETDIMVE